MTRSAIWLACSLSLTGVAQATDLLNATIQIDADAPTQLGRLITARSPSDWSSPTVFPAVVNTSTPYHYATFDIDIAALETGYTYSPYLQFTFDSPSPLTFLSAYLGSYVPTDKAANYLGDEGSRGNAFGVDPRVFQIVMPNTQHLVLLLNEATPNGGLETPGNLLIEAFADTEYTDLTPAAAVPEPASWALLAGGLALVGVIQRRRAGRTVSTPT